ncbi:hypothetical protein Y032_0455g1755 [Ancylostoma ceylanicum]|uniref:ZP domain-containing protein n=1 Tax=Ancylostoma ceylanicum TaxID=53326 RepID=A0A016WXT6_9BILA|nr:hypothetical protein Y032_0455g1755 [Ancylostoma ceylanicum]
MIEGGTKGVREVKIFKVLTFYLLISLMMVEELDALHCNGETDEEGKKFFACRVRISIFDPYSCRGKLEIVTMDEKELALAMKFENNEEITTGLVFNKASTPNELEFFCLAGDCEEKLNELSNPYQRPRNGGGGHSFRCVFSVISAYQQSYSMQGSIRKTKRKATYAISPTLTKSNTIPNMVEGQTSSVELETLLPTAMQKLTTKEAQTSDMFFNRISSTSTLAIKKEIGSTKKRTRTTTTSFPRRTKAKKKKPSKDKQIGAGRTSAQNEAFTAEEVLRFGVPIMLVVLLFVQLHLLCLLRWLKSNYVLIPRSEIEDEGPDIIDDHEVPEEAATPSSRERSDALAVGGTSSVGYSSATSGLTATSPILH